MLKPIPEALNSGSAGVLSAIAAFAALLPDLDATELEIKHLVVSGIKPFLLPSQGLLILSHTFVAFGISQRR